MVVLSAVASAALPGVWVVQQHTEEYGLARPSKPSLQTERMAQNDGDVTQLSNGIERPSFLAQHWVLPCWQADGADGVAIARPAHSGTHTAASLSFCCGVGVVDCAATHL